MNYSYAAEEVHSIMIFNNARLLDPDLKYLDLKFSYNDCSWCSWSYIKYSDMSI